MLTADQTLQYNAVRTSAGIIDRGARGRIVVRGNDRKTFLHALLTNDIAILAANAGCYAAFLTPQGRMVADMHVFELGDATLLDVPLPVKDSLLAKFDQLIFTEDVQIADATGACGCVSVQGAEAPRIVGRTLGGGSDSGAETLAADLSAWPAFRSARIDLDGEVAILARVDEFLLPGFLLFAPAGLLPKLAAALSAAGAALPDPEVVETLRMEAGVPLFLVDMTDDTIPLEAGIEAQAISSTKGCYPGQEVIVRIRDRGHGRVVRKLVGLTIDGAIAPQPGDKLLIDGKESGHVTSAAVSPALGKPIALGYVHRDHATPGTRMSVARGDARLDAAVTALPFVPFP